VVRHDQPSPPVAARRAARQGARGGLQPARDRSLAPGPLRR
jgi:hypothetical protein